MSRHCSLKGNFKRKGKIRVSLYKKLLKTECLNDMTACWIQNLHKYDFFKIVVKGPFPQKSFLKVFLQCPAVNLFSFTNRYLLG
jgi:hypothetical protein